MMQSMSKRERVAATLKCEVTDRPPASFWRHFFQQELTAEGLAQAMLDWQRAYDWDFVKVNARASYHVEDWGNRYIRSGNDRDHPRLDWYRVREPDEWHRLEDLTPTKGVLGEHLQAIRLIRQGVGPDVPVLMTVFTPLSIAADLAGNPQLMRQHLANHPAEVEGAVRHVTAVFKAFAAECLNAGADGLFFATTKWATTDAVTSEQYGRFGRPYDLEVLESVREAPFNLLHVCGSHNMLKDLLDYPVHAFNWDATDPTNPSIEEIVRLTPKAVMGGVSQGKTRDDGQRGALVAEAAAAARAAHARDKTLPHLEAALPEVKAAREYRPPRGWMLGAGCVLPTDATDGNIRALRQAAGT